MAPEEHAHETEQGFGTGLRAQLEGAARGGVEAPAADAPAAAR